MSANADMDNTVLADLLLLVGQQAGCDAQVLRGEQRFFADLGLTSIDAVVLGERLEGHFGRPLQFAEGLAELAQAGRDDVTLAEIATFVAARLAAPEQG